MSDVIKMVPAAQAGSASAGAGGSAPLRKLTISVLRYNPAEPDIAPRMQSYELEEVYGMTLFIALNEIREKQDPSLQFDFVCRAGICGSCAMVRTESRGAHYRQDFPRRNDAEWLKRTLASWTGEADSLPTLAYEALDVGRMELPPGWRGYGAKDYVDHPDTPVRAAEVEALKQKMAGASRFEVQQALMPYESMLPEKLRGRNERIDEPFEAGK